MLLHVFDSWHLASTAKEPRTCEPVYRELALWEAVNALEAFDIGPRTNVSPSQISKITARTHRISNGA